jgi:hypothetical protein
MSAESTASPEIANDPVLRYLLSGEAQTLHEAEELFLNASMPDILRLLAGPLSDDELSRHPLMVMLLAHGNRGWEDSTR